MSTKRFVLKAIAHMYDPLVWLSPFTVRAKAPFQKLWQRHIEWDDQLPQDLDADWIQWCGELNKLQNIQVQRCYRAGVMGIVKKTSLHVFADASPSTYGAVICMCHRC